MPVERIRIFCLGLLVGIAMIVTVGAATSKGTQGEFGRYQLVPSSHGTTGWYGTLRIDTSTGQTWDLVRPAPGKDPKFQGEKRKTYDPYWLEIGNTPTDVKRK